MSKQTIFRAAALALTLVLLVVTAGCGSNTANENPAPTSPPPLLPTETPPIPTETASVHTGHEAPVVDPNVLYQDDFTDPTTGWAAETFDNYFIGYHEPEYYHIAITSPNYRTAVFIPNRPTFEDATIEVKDFTFASKTAETGDFRYGLIFRRSGDQYYAFTVSQRTKTWAVLKSTGNGVEVLKEGSDSKINDFDVPDDLRVDARGSTFTFQINGGFIAQVDDPDYASGEVGFYVQTLDAPSLHIHFDSIRIRKYEAPEVVEQPAQSASATLYEDIFTNPNTAWPERTFDNYFIGYHEPEYYHIAITGTNYKTTVFIPDKPLYTDFTIEVDAFTFASKTAESGDFRYGVAFRRSGDAFYAFTVSQRSKKWAVLKSTPNALVVLKEGVSTVINDLDIGDTLRVDAKDGTFFFHINDEFIAQVEDAEYAEGEIGFFVQTLDAESLHIHYDALTVRTFEPRLVCSIEALQMHIRTGPGTSYSSTSFLSKGANVEPVGRSADGEWISIKVEGSGEQGWIANVPAYVACNSTLTVLPVINP
jgi:hypothetical protein